MLTTRNRLKVATIIFTILFLVLSSATIEKLVEGLVTEQLEELKSDSTDSIAAVTASIEAAIYSDIYTANSLATLLTLDAEFVNSRYDEIAGAIINNSRYIRNISTFPNDIITKVYPLKGNERALGLDFRQNPQQYATVLQAKNSQSVVIAGPLTLVQGGQAIIARFPVFSDFPDNNNYWGGVSVVIDISKLFTDSGLPELSESLDVAIRGVDGTGEDGAVFYGEPTLFNQADILKSIHLMSGNWLLAARFKPQSQAHSVNKVYIARIIGYTVALLFLASILTFIRAYRIAQKASFADELTQLPNRRYAMQLLARYGDSKSNKFAIINIDLNGLKFVNDNYGHDAGDLLLTELSQKLSNTLRMSDTLARLGGDEFLIILPRTHNLEDIKHIVNKLKDAVSMMNLEYKEHQLPTSFSAGIGIFPKDSDDIDELMKLADKEMYLDKQRFKAKQSNNR